MSRLIRLHGAVFDANVLHLDQSTISQLERRSDMYVSTLADFIRAMGGELEIRANFPDGSVRIAGRAESAQPANEPHSPK